MVQGLCKVIGNYDQSAGKICEKIMKWAEMEAKKADAQKKIDPHCREGALYVSQGFWSNSDKARTCAASLGDDYYVKDETINISDGLPARLLQTWHWVLRKPKSVQQKQSEKKSEVAGQSTIDKVSDTLTAGLQELYSDRGYELKYMGFGCVQGRSGYLFCRPMP